MALARFLSAVGWLLSVDGAYVYFHRTALKEKPRLRFLFQFVFIATLRLSAPGFLLPTFVSPSFCVRRSVLVFCISFSYAHSSPRLQRANVKPLGYYSRRPRKHHPRTIQLLTMSIMHTHADTHRERERLL